MGACNSRGKICNRSDQDIDFSKAGQPIFAFNTFLSKSVPLSRRASTSFGEIPLQFCAISHDGRKLFISEFQSHFVQVFETFEVEHGVSPRPPPTDTSTLLEDDDDGGGGGATVGVTPSLPQGTSHPSHKPNIGYRPCFVIGGRGTGDGKLYYPAGVAINDTLGHLIVCDHSNHRLQAYALRFHQNEAKFRFKFAAKAPDSHIGEKSEVSHPYGVVVHPITGDIFACDSGNNRVLHFDQTGKFFKVIGGRGTGLGKFETPYCAAVCGSELQYLAVTDFDLNRVQLFEIGSGDFVIEMGSGNLKNPKSISVDHLTDILYVADSGNHKIKGFRLDSSIVFSVGGLGDELGQFNSPSGIAVDHYNRRLVVCDTGNFRVQVLRLAEPKNLKANHDSCFSCFPVSPRVQHGLGTADSDYLTFQGLVVSPESRSPSPPIQSEPLKPSITPTSARGPRPRRVSFSASEPICISPKFVGSEDMSPKMDSPKLAAS